MNRVEEAIIAINKRLLQKFHVFITLRYGAMRNVSEYAERALREYMENHISEFDDELQ